jgi:hypothetical protein
MIDPSLAGRRLTISLDSVPYDQALEIVMTQINAAMRVRDSIVLFGDRAYFRSAMKILPMRLRERQTLHNW